LALKAKHENGGGIDFQVFRWGFRQSARDFQESLENRSILDGFTWILRDPESWIRRGRGGGVVAQPFPQTPEGYIDLMIWKDL